MIEKLITPTPKEREELLHSMYVELKDNSTEEETKFLQFAKVQLTLFAYVCKKYAPKCEFDVVYTYKNPHNWRVDRTVWCNISVKKGKTEFKMLSPEEWQNVMQCNNFTELEILAQKMVFGKNADVYQ